MNKIIKMYVIDVYEYPDYPYGEVNFPFLDWIYEQCDSKDIKIIDKFLFKYWYYNGILWNLYTKTQEDDKFLYL
jgi:hypothetical protein